MGGLVGHERQRAWFRAAMQNGRLASTFLFVGPNGIGKRRFARLVAQALLCEQVPASELAPCGTCSNCIQVLADSHPDVLYVSKPEDRAAIPVELLIGRREHRMQEGLCHDIRLRPMSGTRRIAILDDCDLLNQEGANALLKTLEEPPSHAVIILIGSSAQRQLPTIRSRCQIIRFDPLSLAEGTEVLRRQLDPQKHSVASIEEAVQLANGDVSVARHLLNEEVQTFSTQLNQLLDNDPPQAVELAETVSNFVEAAGKEASARRERLREVGRMAAKLYRDRLRESAVQGNAESPETRRSLYRLLRCLAVPAEVDRNANQATLIECWAADLQRGKR